MKYYFGDVFAVRVHLSVVEAPQCWMELLALCACPIAVVFLMVYIAAEKSRNSFYHVFLLFVLKAFSAGN